MVKSFGESPSLDISTSGRLSLVFKSDMMYFEVYQYTDCIGCENPNLLQSIRHVLWDTEAPQPSKSCFEVPAEILHGLRCRPFLDSTRCVLCVEFQKPFVGFDIRGRAGSGVQLKESKNVRGEPP
jgi:hypothetical protein